MKQVRWVQLCLALGYAHWMLLTTSPAQNDPKEAALEFVQVTADKYCSIKNNFSHKIMILNK